MSEPVPKTTPGSANGSAISDVSNTLVRKSHKKSRAGCLNCKTRRIKCDELKPQCQHCQSRHVHCRYAKPGTSSGLDRHSSEELPISDVELMFHWTASTHHSLSAWPNRPNQWLSHTSSIILHHKHALHSTLSFTALHLAFCRPDSRPAYMFTADHHYDRALAHLIPALAPLDPTNADAVFLSAQMLCFINWARGPQPGEYLAFGTHGRAEWLGLFHGVRSTLATRRACAEKQHTEAPGAAPRRNGVRLPSTSGQGDVQGEYEAQLLELRRHAQDSGGAADCDDSVRAVDVLCDVYRGRYEGFDEEYHVVFAWLFRVSGAFLDRLQGRTPGALIVYAYFVVLLQDMERFWYMKGWTHHIMRGIWDALRGEEERRWLTWPGAMIGWIAP